VRLLSVLAELGLIEVGLGSPGGPACRLGTGERTRLERSATYRESRRVLSEAEAYLISQGAASATQDQAARPCEARPPATVAIPGTAA
jgi:hypothetical protein